MNEFVQYATLSIECLVASGDTKSKYVLQVFLASASPPVKFPNVYGVDMPSKKEFVASGRTDEEVRATLNADGLIYQSVEDLIAAGQELNPSIKRFDASCFTGSYVTGDIDEQYLQDLETEGRGANRNRPGRSVNLTA